MVERWVVVPRGAGSSPVSPDFLSRSLMVEHGSVKPGVAGSNPVETLFCGVAELVDAVALGAIHYGFKSHHLLLLRLSKMYIYLLSFVLLALFINFRKTSARIIIFFSHFNITFDLFKFYTRRSSSRNLCSSDSTATPYANINFVVHVDGKTHVMFSHSYSFIGRSCFVYKTTTTDINVFWAFSSNVYNSNTFFFTLGAPIYKNVYNIPGTSCLIY